MVVLLTNCYNQFLHYRVTQHVPSIELKAEAYYRNWW